MPNTPQTVRIFISSPGDVIEERDGARRVIEGLERLYPGATLQPVLWEELALPVTASFQETIDFLLEREPIDVAVFILWSRLGSPLGTSITRPDGTAYRSGTEREFDLMLAAFEKSGRKRPVILAYVREDDAAFKQRLTESPTSELEEFVNQRKRAESFIREQFHDAEGRNLRAYQTYREPVGFVQRLRLHLRSAIDDLLGADSAVGWTEDPYRGLEAFDLNHAAIFHGREEETCELLLRMRDQEQAGCAFTVIVGASGSGKSSLARAGVAANLVQHAGDDDTTQWRVASFVPALAAEDLCAALVQSMADSLPELSDSAHTLHDIAESLAENAELTIRLSIAPGFARASDQAGHQVRWLLILDQLEELWTDRQTTSQDRERFLAAIEALACSGHVAVLATLRSDFYPHAQQMPTFLRLKGERGHYDLLPPEAASLQRLITEPARMAGLKFERQEQTGHTLDEVILEHAARDPNALPLVEYTLAELYQQRDESRRLLTFAAYEELGGVEGALGKRADETFQSLPTAAQDALDEILPLLVTVDTAGEQSAVRRRARVADLTSTPGRKTLTESLTAARFLTTDRQDDAPIASLAHEALLRRWERIVNWINGNREQLRRRARIEQTQQQWEQQDRHDSLLLSAGLPLDEGRQLLREAPHLLTDTTTDYIEASVTHHQRTAKRSKRQRTIVISSIAALLVMMIAGGIFLRWSTNATRLAKGLLQAETSEVPNILAELADYPVLSRDELTKAFAASTDESNAKLHAGLALLANDDSVLPFLKERLLTVSSAQFASVRDLLEKHPSDLTKHYWTIAKDEQQDAAHRFQAACALATLEPDNGHWQNKKFGEFIAGHLVSVRPSDLLPWRNALRPVQEHVTDPLAAIYRDDNRDVQVRDFATDTLADYLSDDAEGLFDLLADANQKQFAPIFDKLTDHPQRAIELGNAEVAKRTAPDAGEDDKEAIAKRQANAAVMLLRMGASDQVWPLLKHSPDPRVRSYIIHWLRPLGADPNTILARYKQETDVTSKRALLLCLGEFDESQLPAPQRDALIETLLTVYRNNPDAGLHGAAHWLLRKWGKAEQIAAIDIELQQNEEQLQSVKDDQRQWYVNGQNQTFVVLDAGEFSMGSPNSEVDRNSDEVFHRRQIGRRFAIATTEVTKAQWRLFDTTANTWSADQEQLQATVRTDDSPMNAMTWYEAAWYCNWLSEQEKIPEDQWCYQRNDNDEYGPGMRAKKNFLKLNGYRLPTGAEWEFACRAGATSSRYYGQSETLLSQYAWYQLSGENHTWPVANLKPNDFGLFDMQGNVNERCYEAYGRYRVESDEVIEDAPATEAVEAVSDTNRRVSRGGSFLNRSSFVRSAFRNGYLPVLRDISFGFRAARTYDLSP